LLDEAVLVLYKAAAKVNNPLIISDRHCVILAKCYFCKFLSHSDTEGHVLYWKMKYKFFQCSWLHKFEHTKGTNKEILVGSLYQSKMQIP
jgi:hypothetical protein